MNHYFQSLTINKGLGLQIPKYISNGLLLNWTMLGCFGYLDGKRKLKDIAAIKRC